jgi:phosphoglycerol transferase MdoB-like AlkP superfamily enzyme
MIPRMRAHYPTAGSPKRRFEAARVFSAWRTSRWWRVGAAAGIIAVVAVGERDLTSLPFAFACLGALVSTFLLLTRRPAFSIACALFVFAASAFASMAKFKHMSVNAQVMDLHFYLRKPDTLLFLMDEFWPAIAGFVGLLVVAAVTLGVLRRRERPARLSRAAVAAVALVSVGCAVATRPVEAATLAYYIRKNHFFSSLFASAGDLVRLNQESALKTRTDAMPDPSPVADEVCAASATSPDIVVVLQESAVAPERFPSWHASPLLQSSFKSFDGQTHGLRVETYAGGTWISVAQFMTGLSMADLDWRRPYATLTLEGKVGHSLPQHLKKCGYKTVAISPLTYNFVNEGPFLTSIGIDEVLDYKAIGAKSKHEPDDVYYGAALDAIKRHRASGDGRPLFVFLMTMTAHAPYDYRYETSFKVDGEPFGNAPEVDEYLRRLTMARLSLRAFVSSLQAVPERGFVVAEFGDHHPVVTKSLIEAREGPDALSNDRSAAYETYYAITTVGRPPASALPSVATMDLSYLAVTLLETAGIPLGNTFGELSTLRDRCDGAFHSCADRPAVDRYLKRLTASGRLVLP